jgi:pimeloyl-ACP methyl ester carboxylesterase
MDTPQLQYVDTSLLHVGYQDWNPQGQHAVVLMHGWPDSIRCWAEVAPVLVAAGYRVIVPALRGFNPTSFLHADTPRAGQLAALGRDLIELVAALKLTKPALVGHDWGARAVANACGLQPGIASHLVMMSVGYGTNSPQQEITLQLAQNYWYHWYMNTPRGVHTVKHDRRNFTKLMWDNWAPKGWYTQAEFEATAAAFENDDWADVVLHSYCHRWGHMPGDAAYAEDDARLNPAPLLSVPTLVLHGGADSCNPPASSEGKERFFTGPYQRQVVEGAGHFPQREAPIKVAQAILGFLKAQPLKS